jgi:hypothetical protein
MAAILIFSTLVRSGELQLYFLSKQILMAAILIFSTWCALVCCSCLAFPVERKQILMAAILIFSTWCALVCCSRLYLGMHSLADIVVGLFLSSCLLPLFSLMGEHAQKLLGEVWPSFGVRGG